MTILRGFVRAPAIPFAFLVGVSELALILIGIILSWPSPTQITNVLTLGALATVGILVLLYIPELGIGLYLFSGIFKTATVFGDPGSLLPTLFIVSLTTACLLLRTPLVMASKPKIDPILGLLVLFALFMFASVGRFAGLGALEKTLRFIFVIAASSIMPFFAARSPERLLNTLRWLALFSALTAALSVAFFILATADPLRSVTLFESNDVVFGRTLATGILMCFGLLLYDTTLSRGWRWLLLATLPLMMMSLVLSTSRGAIVGLAVAVPFALLIYRRRLPLWIWGILALGGFTFYLVANHWSTQVQDINGFAVLTGQGLDMSSRQRLAMYQLALQQFLANPLWGIGTRSNDYYPHNIFLEIASELGSIGLLLFLALLWQLYRKIHCLLVNPLGESYRIATQLIAIGLVYSVVIAQFSANLQQQRPLWLFVGLAWALPLRARTN